jgi:ankyrin repeat protein
MTLSGRHIREGASLIVNGRKAAGTIKIEKKDRVVITLETLPEIGIHFLQVQNPSGLFSNDFIFHVKGDAANAEQLKDAIASGSLSTVKKLIAQGAKLNALPEDGGSPLSTAAFHGRLEIARHLIEKGARLSFPNKDGNTPLHVAAFMGRTEMVKLFLAKGASTTQRNNNRDTPIDSVSGDWNEGLTNFYRSLNNTTANKVDLKKIQKIRPQLAKLLREHAAKSNK